MINVKYLGKKSIIKPYILNSIKITQCKETAEHGMLNYKPLFPRLCRKVGGGGKLNGRLDPSDKWTQMIFVDHVLRGKSKA